MRIDRVHGLTAIPLTPAKSTDWSARFESVGVVWVAAICALASIQTALILGHRPWLDEWQALQIALESPTVADLLANLRYEGHPPLWYLVLRAIGSVVPPGWVLVAALLPIAVVTQATILWRAPFTRGERLMLAAGELMMFEYLTVARSLSLGVMCFVLAIALRRSRWVWAPIALLPMCDFLFGVLSIALIVLQWRDRRLWTPGVTLWLVVGLLAAWCVSPAPDIVPALPAASPVEEFGAWITHLGVSLVPLQAGKVMPIGWNAAPPLLLGAVFGPLFLWFVYHETRGRPLDRLLVGGFVAVTLAFDLAIYELQPRHLSLAALLLVGLRWRAAEDGAAEGDAGCDRMFRVWLAVGATCGLLVASINLVVPFDTAPEVVRAIRTAKLEDRTWASFPESSGQGVTALSGIEFLRLGQECRQSFIRWNSRTSFRPASLERYLRDLTRRHGRIYLLTELPLDRLNGGFFHGLIRRIAHVPAGFDGQVYTLFVVAPDRPDRGWRPPPCVARRTPMAHIL